MNYKIFLDDIRMPTDIYPKTDNKDWMIIRNLTDFKNVIETRGVPDFISFDNDLGSSMEEGKHAVKWMVYEKWLDISNMDFNVHSANSSGVREDIESILNGWKRELQKEKTEMQKNKIRKEVREILKGNFLQEGEVRMKYEIQIPADIMKIKNLLKQRGHKLFVVGGAVRDALLGKTPKDYDLATDALPDTIQGILSPYYKTLETGKAFGIINVLTPSGEYEIATFRKDIGAGRRPDTVEFTTIDQDVNRRDLTINALFYDIDTGEVVDLVGGVDDLRKGIVRTVGSAEDRFAEDRLRILRAIRFAGRFGSELDPSVDAALKKDSRLGGFPTTNMSDTMSASNNVSSERIRDEFLKGIISAKSVKHFLGMIQKYDLFQWIFGPLSVRSESPIEEHDVPVLLGYLLSENNIEFLKKELNKLKYSADDISQVSFLTGFTNLVPENAFRIKKAQSNSKLSNEQIRKFAQWMHMDMKLVDAFLSFSPSITGQELMAQGFKGKELGDEMERRETDNFLNILKK